MPDQEITVPAGLGIGFGVLYWVLDAAVTTDTLGEGLLLPAMGVVGLGCALVVGYVLSPDPRRTTDFTEETAATAVIWGAVFAVAAVAVTALVAVVSLVVPSLLGSLQSFAIVLGGTVVVGAVAIAIGGALASYSGT